MVISGDQRTLDGIKLLIAQLEAEKQALHPPELTRDVQIWTIAIVMGAWQLKAQPLVFSTTAARCLLKALPPLAAPPTYVTPVAEPSFVWRLQSIFGLPAAVKCRHQELFLRVRLTSSAPALPTRQILQPLSCPLG
jgi:hypothetical protein